MHVPTHPYITHPYINTAHGGHTYHSIQWRDIPHHLNGTYRGEDNKHKHFVLEGQECQTLWEG